MQPLDSPDADGWTAVYSHRRGIKTSVGIYGCNSLWGESKASGPAAGSEPSSFSVNYRVHHFSNKTFARESPAPFWPGKPVKRMGETSGYASGWIDTRRLGRSGLFAEARALGGIGRGRGGWASTSSMGEPGQRFT